MATGMRLKVNKKGVLALLKDPRVEKDLMRRAKAIAERAGGEAEGFVAEKSVSPDRVAVQVSTTTLAARKREAEKRTLTRAIDAGRS